MNAHLSLTRIQHWISAILCGSVLLIATSPALSALDNLLANQPLANSTTIDILPNIAVLLDDSGSMDWEYMPDSVGGNSGKNCYYWYKHNGVYYNPNMTYLPPIKLNGTIYSDGKPRYPDAQFTSALKDGYYLVTEKQFDQDTANSTTDLSKFTKFYAIHKTDPLSTTCETDSKYTLITNSSNIAAPGVTTGSADALTNYANWYSYYRKRAFLAKAAVGEAFYRLNQDQYRIGLFFINSLDSNVTKSWSVNNDLKIDKFSGTSAGHRYDWFSKLNNFHAALWTPNRGALSRMGQMYAGKIAGWDPVQYSCQRNYTILMTDGYWNTGVENSSYGPYDVNGTAVGDQDKDISIASRPSYAPSTAKSIADNTLADIAYYYYHNDLRPGKVGDAECTAKVAGPDGKYHDVCKDNVAPQGTIKNVDDIAEHQHMTTFTIGLGVNGTLTYINGYKTTSSGDYYSILSGTGKEWPNPLSNDQAKIDDLWHAAVSGRGVYFSANDRNALADGLKSVLDSIKSVGGSGAAAATSNLQPTPGEDQIFIASYRTVNWDGELTAYKILKAGQIDNTALWTASSKIPSPTDRKVFTSTTGSTTLRDFLWANLTPSEQNYFKEAVNGNGVDDLSQYSTEWSAAAQKAASNTPGSLVDYLRGAKTFTYDGTTYDLYRPREKILGDIVHSQPVFVKESFYNFVDDKSYGGRSGTVYVGANDGMLHAFDESGTERWAYVPPFLIKNMWRLADKNYATNHRFYIDGPIAVSDVQIGGKWQTILVGAVGKGGRGYYALNITDPTKPTFLWTFTADDNPNVGYTYGTPMITKLNGEWVVLVSSGYNNIPEGTNYATADGQGYVWALDAAKGTIKKTWSTGVGGTTEGDPPSGLSGINIKVIDFQGDNSMEVAYGGDLRGNMYRFTTDGKTEKVIKLDQPITVAPEIGEISGHTVLLFGTGRYLGTDDLENKDLQAFYAVKDKKTGESDKSKMTQKTISGVSSVTGADPDWDKADGWYVNLPESKERVNLGAQLYFGTVVFATTIPNASECQPGGSGRLYFLNYETGGRIDTYDVYSTMYSPVVGFTVAKVEGGTPVIYPITADGGYPTAPPPALPIGAGLGVDSGKRIMWRELVN